MTVRIPTRASNIAKETILLITGEGLVVCPKREWHRKWGRHVVLKAGGVGARSLILKGTLLPVAANPSPTLINLHTTILS